MPLKIFFSCSLGGGGRYLSVPCYSAMHSHDARTLAMRCRDAGHSGQKCKPIGAGKTRKTISTIAILWPVKAIFEKGGRCGGGRYFLFPRVTLVCAYGFAFLPQIQRLSEVFLGGGGEILFLSSQISEALTS